MLPAMTSTTDTIDTYLAAYNEADEGARRELVGRAFADAGALVDPPIDGEGHDGITAMMGAVHQQYPGHRFRRASAVDEHHGYFRYGWELCGPGDAVVLEGTDVGFVDEAGRLARVIGFFGPLPDAA
jgi:hypothetical protein